ncbi:MAG: phosphatase PAP2 family protein [Bacteroidetes bacterium]|jgi:membrane-associated phospholipid phosphatase|nr:phosphatase PAP2 family protein [Bacteroidota bacterium]
MVPRCHWSAAVLLLVVLWGLAPAPTNGQSAEHQALEVRVLHAVYGWDSRLGTGALRAVDRTAYPVFYGAPVAAGAGALLTGASPAPAYRLTLASAGAVGATMVIKRLMRRPRPFYVHEAITSRSPEFHEGRPVSDSYALPSGHAALSAAQVTSWCLSHPRWYVIGPGVAWAVGVSVSRVWQGVHYPSDVVVGAVLGAGIGLTVHWIGAALTPSAWQESAAAASAPFLPPVYLRIGL